VGQLFHIVVGRFYRRFFQPEVPAGLKVTFRCDTGPCGRRSRWPFN